MSKHHLRKDKTCQNCDTLVAERFCSHCGQENTETRQSFSHLLRHFFEDLTHYDSGFWKTMKYLLFRPAFLTREYLAGRRAAYVPPVRLYIFVSFVCFFLVPLFPKFNTYKSIRVEKVSAGHQEDTAGHQARPDFRTGFMWLSTGTNAEGKLVFHRPNDYTSVAQMDSMQALLPPQERYNGIQRWMAIRVMETYHHYSDEEIGKKFRESFMHNLPKALFLYMPLFALALWVMQSKKRWMFFDHAIFTLHYFSFLLLSFILSSALTSLASICPRDFFEQSASLLSLGMIGWWIFYFYRAHYKLYNDHGFVSALKSSLLFVVNFIFILFILFGFGLYTLFTLH
ncbi:MAG TPA: DUF3667 domain-containing protein [Chitinophagaceae bacterium]|nr:DUF3667 domain-containing protein [Chitinophagaceae bacterium]